MNIKNFCTTMSHRFAIFGAAFKNLFTGKGVRLQNGLQVCASKDGLTAELNIKRDENTMWEHVALTFDYENPPVAYINGVALGSLGSVSIQAGRDLHIDSISVKG